MSRRTRSVAVAVKAWSETPGKSSRSASELPVLRPEIVSPLADAVRFVDGDEPQARLLQQPPQRLAAVADEPLGRHVEQPAAIVADAREHLVALVRQQRAVQVRRRDAVDAQAVDLILHQRDERRDDDARCRDGRSRLRACDQRRRLEAQRLAAAGRQHDDAVARRREWRASPRAAADGNRRSPRRGGATSRERGDQRRA